MSWDDPCPFQPGAQLGGRYTSVFWHENEMERGFLKVWDLRGQPGLMASVDIHLSSPFTAYDLSVHMVDPLTLLVDDSSWVVSHDPVKKFSPYILDLCACTGAMAVGPIFAGARVLASFEINSLAIQHLNLNKHGIVYQGDLCNDSDIRKFHELVQHEEYSALAGFPCQPFSSQGAQERHSDARSIVFWKILRASALLNVQSLILECVAPVATDNLIQLGLATFTKRMGWQQHQVLLELAQQWPMRRRRWWCAMYPVSWSAINIPAWPTLNPTPTIGHILHTWGLWGELAERDLQLSKEELRCYANPALGKEKRLLSPGDVSPTILHSYGSVLHPCPCGCRSRGISPWALANKGIRGVFVISEEHAQPRYLHPYEVATLLTLPMSMTWGDTPRNDLCLLGQTAAPLQSLWVYTHLTNAAHSVFPDVVKVDPLDMITKYKAEIYSQVRRSNIGGN